MMDNVSSFLWFDGQAQEAPEFDTGLFPDSRITALTHASMDHPGGKAGSVITVTPTLGGRDFIAMNGGPGHPFTDVISHIQPCEPQQNA